MLRQNDGAGNNYTTNSVTVAWPSWWSNGTPVQPITAMLNSAVVESNPDSQTFTLQYGINVLQIPWTSSGTNYKAGAEGDINYIQNDATNYEFAVLMNGGYTFISYSRVDIADTEYDWTTTLPPSTVVIQRTTNFWYWEDIFTNTSCWTTSVETYTDMNAPLVSAYYRAVLVQ